MVNTTLEDKGRISFTLPRDTDGKLFGVLDNPAPGPVTVKFEDSRTITTHGHTLTDTFAPYAVHVYEFTPSP